MSALEAAREGAIVALDGSRIDSDGHEVAGWGASVEFQFESPWIVFGPVPGADQSSWAGEATAMECFTQAAAVANQDFVVLIDCRAVQKTVALLAKGTVVLPLVFQFSNLEMCI